MKMKTAEIITFQWYDNYGTVLQAYALQTALRRLGIAAHIVPMEVARDTGVRRVFSKTLRGTCSKLERFCRERGSRWHDGFEKFRQIYFDYGNKQHCSFAKALKMKHDADYLVFGSDNIWSPWAVGLDSVMAKVFFGDGITHSRKIVYAASTGAALTGYDRKDAVVERIKCGGFQRISCREQSNADFLRERGIQAVLAPDPTLLLDADEWRQITEMPPREHGSYVFGYDLGHPGAISVLSACKEFARRKDLAVRIPFPRKIWAARNYACFPTPVQWLGFVWNAAFVVTNSFHGVMFSLLFHRPFAYIPISGATSGLNARAFAIMERCSLMERVVAEGNRLDDIAGKHIDWDSVDMETVRFRQCGIDYLKEALCM